MASVYEIARALGEELQKTPQVQALLEAKKAYESDPVILMYLMHDRIQHVQHTVKPFLRNILRNLVFHRGSRRTCPRRIKDWRKDLGEKHGICLRNGKSIG